MWSPFFKDRGKMLDKELTKFMGSIWAKEEKSRKWREWVTVPTYKE